MEFHLLSPAHVEVPAPRGRVSGALSLSIAVHAVALAALLWLAYARAHDAQRAADAEQPQRIVWLSMPGPSGGGGGSKATTPPPPRVTPPQAARTLETPAPVVPPQTITPPAPEPAEPQPPAPAQVADTSSSGAASTPATAPGNGTGNGSGSGNGDGVGPGQDKGFGGGAYRPGNGVTTPIPIKRASPAYTAEAMRARAQGVITVECVVEPNGECGDVRIARAFTPPYGLDQQAIDAARRWRFRPGTRGGEPVPVLVNLEIEFNIR